MVHKRKNVRWVIQYMKDGSNEVEEVNVPFNHTRNYKKMSEYYWGRSKKELPSGRVWLVGIDMDHNQTNIRSAKV